MEKIQAFASCSVFLKQTMVHRNRFYFVFCEKDASSDMTRERAIKIGIIVPPECYGMEWPGAESDAIDSDKCPWK